MLAHGELLESVCIFYGETILPNLREESK